MASLLGNTEIPSNIYTHSQTNAAFSHSKCLKTFKYNYELFFNKSKENNTDAAFKKVVVFESSKQKAYENSECPVEVRMSYVSYEKNENISRFG